MKRHAGIAIVAAVLASVLSLSLPLEALAQEGQVRGKFVRLTEKKVGEREYVGVVIAPEKGKEEVVVLMGRESKLLPKARKLGKGQQVEIAYVTEGKHKWVKRIGAPAAEAQVKGKQKRARRVDAPAAKGQVRGKFLRLAEKKVGKREHLAVVVLPDGGKDEVVVLVGRDSEVAARARKLRKGQQVEITYVVEGEHKWARRAEAARGEDADLREQIRLLKRRLEQMEKELNALRMENAKLKKQLREKREATASEEAPRP